MDVKGCDDEAPFSKHKTRLLNCTVCPHCTNAPSASTYHQPQPHPTERNTVTVRNKNSRSERNTNSSQPMKMYYSDPAVGTMLFATLCRDEQNMNPNRAGMFPEILGGPPHLTTPEQISHWICSIRHINHSVNVNNYANLLYFNNTPFTGVFGLYMANKTLTSMLSLLWTNAISPLLVGRACQHGTPDNSLLRRPRCNTPETTFDRNRLSWTVYQVANLLRRCHKLNILWWWWFFSLLELVLVDTNFDSKPLKLSFCEENLCFCWVINALKCLLTQCWFV